MACGKALEQLQAGTIEMQPFPGRKPEVILYMPLTYTSTHRSNLEVMKEVNTSLFCLPGLLQTSFEWLLDSAASNGFFPVPTSDCWGHIKSLENPGKANRLHILFLSLFLVLVLLASHLEPLTQSLQNDALFA